MELDSVSFTPSQELKGRLESRYDKDIKNDQKDEKADTFSLIGSLWVNEETVDMNFHLNIPKDEQ